MLEVIISFVYMGLFCFCIGSGVLFIISRHIDLPSVTVFPRIICGIITLTILIGYISIFTRIGIIAHIIMLIFAGLLTFYSRSDIMTCIRSVTKQVSISDTLVYGLLAIIIAYGASRGAFHTDTGIYHAATIRVYEEYGIIRGLANIQQHYGYNSSYLGFAAFFTMSGILPQALHTTTGFLAILTLSDAFSHLKDFKKHSYHYADMTRISCVLYVFMNYTGIMSPATDYGTMLMTGFFLCMFLDVMENERICPAPGNAYDNSYALLSVFGLFLATMKLSSAMCILVMITPLIRFIRSKAFKRLFAFLFTGLISFAFYPIRNIILSGWLFYPFERLDLFNVKWKVPVEYSLNDSAQIRVWARCLFDVNKADASISEWFPIWWEAQEHYDQMLIYGLLIATLVIITAVIYRRKINKVMFNYLFMILANLAVWFFNAPFIRYGLIFIMAYILCSISYIFELETKGMMRYMIFSMGCLILICFFARIDHYMMDDLVFIKHNLKAPYYITQQPFDDPKMEVIYLGEAGIPIYVTDNDEEKNSYYTPPSSCYLSMVTRTIPMGETVKDGFMPEY